LKSKVLIIGAGPAGIAAAIQLRRYGIDFLLIEKDSIGGLLINANLIENYPGFPKGISGQSMIKLYETQLLHFDIHTIRDDIHSIDWNGNYFTAQGSEMYECDYLVIATGTQPEILNLPVTNEYLNKYLFYEVKNLRDMSGNKIAVIGSGDAAFDYALTLAKNNKLDIYMRGKASKAIPSLIDKVKDNPAIDIIIQSQLNRIEIVNERVKAECENYGVVVSHTFDYMLAAIGRKPDLPRLNFEITEHLGKKMFFIGDVKNDLYRQATIASADGIRAAMMIYGLIMEKNESNC
jgi:thioredoxin reductase